MEMATATAKPKLQVKTKGRSSNSILYLPLPVIYIQRKRPHKGILMYSNLKPFHSWIPKVRSSCHDIYRYPCVLFSYQHCPVPNAPAPCDQEPTAGPSITTVDKPTAATSAIPTIAPHGAHYTSHLIIHCI